MKDIEAILDALRNSRMSAYGSGSSLGGGATGIAGGGELNLNIPIDTGAVELMASGGGAYGKAGNRPIREFNLGRVGANLTQGKNNYGIDFDPNDPTHNFMLQYGREF